jgi:flagellar basal body-associated protein FliL
MKRILLAAGAVLALAGCTGLAALLHRPAAPGVRPETTVVVSLPDTTINLRGDDGFSYLRIQVAVTVAGSMPADALQQFAEAHKAAMLDALNNAVQGQRFTDLRTPDGRRGLEAKLEAEFSAVLAPARAQQVYLEEFVAD